LDRIAGQPVGYAQMVLDGGEFGVEREGAFEVDKGLVATIEDGQEEADLVLNAGRVGVECGCLLPSGECGGRIAAGAGGGRLGFELAEGRLGEESGRQERSGR
jgi:hypothetical protein